MSTNSYEFDNLLVVYDKDYDELFSDGLIQHKALNFNLEDQNLCDKYKLIKPKNPYHISYAGKLSQISQRLSRMRSAIIVKSSMRRI